MLTCTGSLTDPVLNRVSFQILLILFNAFNYFTCKSMLDLITDNDPDNYRSLFAPRKKRNTIFYSVKNII